MLRRDGGRVRLVDYPRSAGSPTITVRCHAGLPTAGGPGTHAHDFLVLLYVERGGGVLRVDGRDRALHAGDAFVVAPGAVVTPHAGHGGVDALAWVVFFAADAVDPAVPPVSWRTHLLLSPFGGTRGGGGRRLAVPAEDRATWLAHLGDLDAELRDRDDGYAEAARAHLTLLLVRLARLHRHSADGPGVAPLVAAVLDIVEARYHEPISLRDVADAVGLTAGHLSTVIGHRTGRTVQQWITERRMREARRLLADTDLTVAEIALRVGYSEAGYFVRRFRLGHGVPPATWRRAGRRPSVDADPPPAAQLR
ncbi:MAG: AraC family transcriptional regulator, transcriptional activator of pobA [Pseudonocardiales bacterium]|nr:AraC family transcriptional regulator, transcriptional activator of pobA [Pseudonocardiales bacterium]